MCRQSGGLVIISRVKKFFHRLQLRFFVISVVLAIIPVIILHFVFLNTYETKLIEQRMIEIRQRCNILSVQLGQSGDLSSALTDSMVQELGWYSEAYGGRLMIVSSDYRILVDTYGIDEGRTCVSREVFQAFDGTEYSAKKQGSHYVEFVLPITVQLGANDTSAEAAAAGTSTRSVTPASNTSSAARTTTTAVSGVLIFTSTTDWIENTTARTSWIFILVEAIIYIVLVILTLFISFLLTRPITRVSKQLNRIGEGDMEVDLDKIQAYTEIDDIMHSAAGVIKKYQDMEQSRQEFVSNVSHELKTPMTSIRVLADSMIGQEGVPEEMYQEFLSDISVEVERESRIIEDLLTMVRMEKNSSAMNITQVNINDFVMGIMKRLKPIAAEREIELIYESFRQISAAVDEMKLSQAFTNLIENAIKYNNDGGWVRVSLDADHKYFYFKVADCGVGIPEDAIEHVFNRFYRVDKARSRETGGTGLGLSIAKNVVLMHYGIIKVESQLGEGTTFTVRIPLNHVEG